MSNKLYPDSAITMPTDEIRERTFKQNLSKFEHDLYCEEDNIIEKVIRVKRIGMPNKGEKWRVFENNKAIFTIEGVKISKKEKEFLRTIDGVSFIIAQAKIGIKSFNNLRTELKKILAVKLSKLK